MLTKKDVFYHAGNCPHRDEKGYCLALEEGEAGYYCGGYFCTRTPENACCFTVIETVIEKKEDEKA